MSAPRSRLMDVTSAGFTPRTVAPEPDLSRRWTLSEFEYAQARRIAAEGGALAAEVVQWHSDAKDVFAGDLERHLAHGLGVAALGALIMQILAWTRLLEEPDAAPSTLRAARDVIEGADPVLDPSILDCYARGLLHRAQAIKARARQMSRLW